MISKIGKGLLQQTRDDHSRVRDMTVKVTRVTSRVLVVGTGEVSIDVKFPVRFGERPIFTFGGELGENQSPTGGIYPTISAVVQSWDKVDEIQPGYGGYYLGATILVVTTGREGQRMWLHWAMEAKALRNPVATIDTTDDTI